MANYLKKYSDSTQIRINSISQVKSEILSGERIIFESLSEKLKKYESIMLTEQKVSLVKKSVEYTNEIKLTMKN
jgi:hypothetical protein